jgi:hypothetical protein
MKKPIHGLTLLITLLCLLALSSCKDDNDGISADIHSPITGYWQIAGTSIETGADINGDGAVEGIAVHDDGTVSEWQYTQATEDPFKLGYKTGTWTIDGNHYVMLLSKGNNKHYTVTVAGNDNEKMYLAYNGKTSVIPFYRLQHLPGDGDSMMEMMAQMKFSGIQMSDLAGYWELANNDVPNGDGNGIYIDEQGYISHIANYGGSDNDIIEYQSEEVSTTGGVLSFPYNGNTYLLYGVSKDVLLATLDGQKVEKFVRKDVPGELADLEEMTHANLQLSDLVGYWDKGNGSGVYIDEQGNVSDVSIVYSTNNYYSVDYHSGKISTSGKRFSFPFVSTNYSIFGIKGDILFATTDGHQVKKFTRKEVPDEVTRIEEIVNTKVPDKLIGSWGTTHYKRVSSDGYVSNDDITPSDSWSMQMYHKLIFYSNHVVKKYYNGSDYPNTYYFTVDGNKLTRGQSLSDLISSSIGSSQTFQIDFVSDTEMTITSKSGKASETYTYKKIQ